MKLTNAERELIATALREYAAKQRRVDVVARVVDDTTSTALLQAQDATALAAHIDRANGVDVHVHVDGLADPEGEAFCPACGWGLG